jgi:hypothetical protein
MDAWFPPNLSPGLTVDVLTMYVGLEGRVRAGEIDPCMLAAGWLVG